MIIRGIYNGDERLYSVLLSEKEIKTFSSKGTVKIVPASVRKFKDKQGNSYREYKLGKDNLQLYKNDKLVYNNKTGINEVDPRELRKSLFSEKSKRSKIIPTEENMWGNNQSLTPDEQKVLGEMKKQYEEGLRRMAKNPRRGTIHIKPRPLNEQEQRWHRTLNEAARKRNGGKRGIMY